MGGLTETPRAPTAPLPAPPAPAVPPTRRRRRLVDPKLVLEMVAVALGTVLATRLLLRLSGSALWLPSELRNAINVFAPALGIALYTLTRLMAQRFQDGLVARRLAAFKGRGRGEALKHARTSGRLAVVSLAVVVLLGALYAFTAYIGLRARCVIPFQPPESWWAHEFGPDSSIPPFLNRQTGEVYVPLEWDESMRRSLERRGGGDLHAGLRDMLDHEPMKLVDWLSIAGKQPLHHTTRRFFWLHVGIISLAAIAAGLTFVPIHSLLKESVDVII